METDRWHEVESIYHSALDHHHPAQRTIYLQEACGGDESLLREVQSLLDQQPQIATRFLESAALDVAAKALVESETLPEEGVLVAHELPSVIGRYRVIRLLGEGGMATVYEAEQEHPRRVVAIKVIKFGLANSDAVWRFQHECQALGRLQHPGIAQIYEAGTAETGFGPQPYLAMELIRGLTLDRYAKTTPLSLRQKLALLVRICGAVQHAHQRGLIHRDLKPSNIVMDETGQPKVLDFGVARLADEDAPSTGRTEYGRVVGTLSYMSPEQVLGDPLEVDTRSDVYALGVVLYELLAGRLPYEVSRRQVAESARVIREKEPAPLRSISRDCRGDVEIIVGKALEKDKTRRYSSAAEMAADIERYLNEEPIAARAPSASYQVRKFARRHRGLVAGAAAVFVALLAGVAASTVQAIRANRAEQAASAERDHAIQAELLATRERNRSVTAETQAVRERNRAVVEKQRADQEAATSKAISAFLQNDLLAQAGASTQAGPSAKPDPHLEVRTALERAAARISGKFEKQPLVEASVRQTVGFAYQDLGLFAEAELQQERALAIRERILGETAPATWESMDHLAILYRLEGKYAQAEPLRKRLLDLQRRSLGEFDPDTLDAMNNLALLYRYEGKLELAGPLYIKAVAGLRRNGAENHQTVATMSNLAQLYVDLGKFAQAEQLYNEALEAAHRVLGEEHPTTMIVTANLAQLYQVEGKSAQAELLQRKVLEVDTRTLGAEHPSTLVDVGNLARMRRDQGEYAEAEALFGRVLDAQRRVLGEDRPETLTTINLLGSVKWYEGDDAAAEQLFKQALEGDRRVLGNEHPRTLSSLVWLGREQLRQRKLEMAEASFREALRGYENNNLQGWERYHSQSLLGQSLADAQKYAEAEPLLIDGYEGLIQRRDKIPAISRRDLEAAGERIVRLYEEWHKPGKALEWRSKLAADKAAPTPK